MRISHIKFIGIGAGIVLNRLLFSKQTLSAILIIDTSKDISEPSLKYSLEELEAYRPQSNKFCIKPLGLDTDCLLKVKLKKKILTKPFLKSSLPHKKFTRSPEAKARSPDFKGTVLIYLQNFYQNSYFISLHDAFSFSDCTFDTNQVTL